MDEYCFKKKGKIDLVSIKNKISFKYYMNKNFFSKINIVKHYFPSIKNFINVGEYDKLIKKNGGIDICLNSIGENGHTFGFNEPGSSFSSKTRLVKLEKNTRDVNLKLTKIDTPKYAITTGIKTGMNSKEVIFVVSGKRKSKILKEIIYGDITNQVPGSILRTHERCKWIIDKDAASKL